MELEEFLVWPLTIIRSTPIGVLSCDSLPPKVTTAALLDLMHPMVQLTAQTAQQGRMRLGTAMWRAHLVPRVSSLAVLGKHSAWLAELARTRMAVPPEP